MCLLSVASHKHKYAFLLRHIKVFIICRRNASFMCFYLNTYFFLCIGNFPNISIPDPLPYLACMVSAAVF